MTDQAKIDTPLDILKDMRAWSEAYPPQDGWQEKSEHVVHLHPHVRMRITIEQALDIGYGLFRSDKLADHGVFCAELDSQQFASELLKTIGPDLSRRNLKDLIAELEKMQKEWQ